MPPAWRAWRPSGAVVGQRPTAGTGRADAGGSSGGLRHSPAGAPGAANRCTTGLTLRATQTGASGLRVARASPAPTCPSQVSSTTSSRASCGLGRVTGSAASSASPTPGEASAWRTAAPSSTGWAASHQCTRSVSGRPTRRAFSQSTMPVTSGPASRRADQHVAGPEVAVDAAAVTSRPASASCRVSASRSRPRGVAAPGRQPAQVAERLVDPVAAAAPRRRRSDRRALVDSVIAARAAAVAAGPAAIGRGSAAPIPGSRVSTRTRSPRPRRPAHHPGQPGRARGRAERGPEPGEQRRRAGPARPRRPPRWRS